MPDVATSMNVLTSLTPGAIPGFPYQLTQQNIGTIDMATGRAIIALYYWKGAKTNGSFMAGDHWQKGKGWIGPMPEGRDYDFIYNEIKKGFTSRNAVKEVTLRHVDGVLGREPEWGLTPRQSIKDDETIPDNQQNLINEAEAALTDWWNERKIHEFISKSAEQVLWSGRSVFRMYVPKGLLTTIRNKSGATVTGIPKINNLPDALSYIWPDVPLPENSTVWIDPDTKEMYSLIYSYDNLGRDRLEVSYIKGKAAGTSTPDIGPKEARATVITNITADGTTSVELDFGGRITSYEINRDPLINEQVQEQQRALNLAVSIMPRTIVTSGFLERVILGGQMPGEFIDDPNNPGKKIFKPGKYQVGAGTTNWISGQAMEDEQGNVKYTTPSIEWREPTDPQASIKASRFHYQNILEEVDQEHVLISGDALASGKAREQARAGFMLSLTHTQKPIEALGRWIIETALSMSEAFMGEPGKYTKELRSYFNCRLDSGPVTAEERTNYAELVDKGVVSLETAMHLIGINDVDAELIRIRQQKGHQIHLEERIATVLGLYVQAEFPMVEALKRLGVEEGEATRIQGIVDKAKQDAANQQLEQIRAKGVGSRPEDSSSPPARPK